MSVLLNISQAEVGYSRFAGITSLLEGFLSVVLWFLRAGMLGFSVKLLEFGGN